MSREEEYRAMAERSLSRRERREAEARRLAAEVAPSAPQKSAAESGLHAADVQRTATVPAGTALLKAAGGRQRTAAENSVSATPSRTGTAGRTAAAPQGAAKAPAAPAAKAPADRQKPADGQRLPASQSAARKRAARRRARRRKIIQFCAAVCVIVLLGTLLGHGFNRIRARSGNIAASVETLPPSQLPADLAEAGFEPAEEDAPSESGLGMDAPSPTGEPDAEQTLSTAEPGAEATPLAADGQTAPDASEEPAATPAIIAVAPTIAPMETAPIPELREMLAMGEIADSALPTAKKYKYQSKIVADGKTVDEYIREAPVAMNSGEEYSRLEGVLTFRGNNYRDTAAYGTVPDNASGLEIVWEKQIGSIEKWTGVGWTGQASIVRWPEKTRLLMNINEEKKAKDGLCEVIYGTLDGHIYFLDLDDGEETRAAIEVPSSIKGSVSVDPRGIPLLYCGQGIPEVKGKSVKIGTRVFSLIDQECLYFLNGRDDYCLRGWYAFDCAPLIDAASDTMIQLGENGIVYTVTLNTEYDSDTGALSVDPVVDRLVYKSAVTTRMGMENSPSVYDHYAYYTDNSGLLTCLDLNTMEPVWLGDVGDDSDSSLVLEEEDGNVWLYTVCELDLNGLSGNVYCRKFNALTGEEIWSIPVDCYRGSKNVDAGGFATPAVGKGSLGDLVFFNVCRTRSGGGQLAAVNKNSGEVVWAQSTGAYSWSSPVCVYDSEGRGYIIYGNSMGVLRLCNGLTGEEIAQVELGANIEGSPAVFGDMLVVGTRGSKIFGVKITG